jgi:hypothetical protein
MAANFRIYGPFEIPVEGEYGKYIEINCPAFWEKPETAKFAHKRGCYLFAIRAARGYRPIYIGKTARSFEQECFTSHKLSAHFQPALANAGKGTPVLFLVVLKQAEGPTNRKAIGRVESFLIQNALVKNHDLSNIQGKKEEKWGISGVIRGGKGKASKSVKAFKSALGL